MPLTIVLTVVAVVAAAANWWATARDDDRLDHISKPIVTAALVAVAATHAGAAPGARPWWVVALVACLIGDVLLLLPDAFLGGLVAFLVGHVAFVVGMTRLHPAHGGAARVRVALAVIVVVAELVIVVPRLLPAVRRDEPALVGPVVAYVLVIWTMLVVTGWRAGWWGLAGAALFSLSDALLALDRFVRRSRRQQVAVMVTYHAALTGLLVALFR